MIQAERAEVIADGLERAVERLRDSSEIRSARRWRGPRRDEWRNPDERQSRTRAGIWRWADDRTRKESISRVVVRHEIHTCLVQVLAELFIVAEHKCLILPDRSSQSGPELIAMKPWNGGGVEEIPGVESVIPEEFVQRAVERVSPRLSDD